MSTNIFSEQNVQFVSGSPGLRSPIGRKERLDGSLGDTLAVPQEKDSQNWDKQHVTDNMRSVDEEAIYISS